jgi:exopolysaccharide biosynthesis polyprenyl glycosylphosphotransferase
MSVPASKRVVVPELAQGRLEGVERKFPSFTQACPAPFAERAVLVMLGDALLIVLAVLAAVFLWSPAHRFEPSLFRAVRPSLVWVVVLVVGWWVMAWLNDLYHIPSLVDKGGNAVRVAAVGLINLLVYGTACLMIPNQLPWGFCLFFLAIVWPATTLWRVAFAAIVVQPNFQRRALIVGTGSTARSIARAIEDHDRGCEVIGYVAGDRTECQQKIGGLPVFEDWHNLARLVQDRRVSDLILADRCDMQAGQMQAVLKCFELGVRIVPMPELFEGLTGRVPVEHIDERWLVHLPIGWDSQGMYLVIKRAMDVVLSFIGLLFLLPVLPFLALAIRLDSPGPVFYRVERLGQSGKPFHMWKFRTMVANADRIGDPTFTAQHDQRITRVGRLLRRFHVDELPQFLNVFTGEMSIVGPRPERFVPELEERIPYYRTRLAVKPGATGWGLVRQGYAEDTEGTLVKLQYDLYYVKHQSLSLDILIMYKSLVHMITMRGQ